MDYKLTHYIYPIQKPICLSKELGFYLDNPRGDIEIKEIRDRLSGSRKTSYFQLIAQSEDDFSNAEKYLLDFRDHFSSIDPYVLEFFEGYKSEKILDYIARLWLIIRYCEPTAHS